MNEINNNENEIEVFSVEDEDLKEENDASYKEESVDNKKKKFSFKKLFKQPLFYVGLLQVLFSLFLMFILVRIEVIGFKFLIPIYVVIILIDFLILFFLKRSKKKKTKIILSILSVILSIIYFVGSVILYQVYASTKDIFKNDSFIYYSVFVEKNSKIDNIKDTDDKIVGFYIEDKYNESAQKGLDKKVKVQYVGYSSVDELKCALLDGKIDAMLIMNSYLELDNDNSSEVDLESEVEVKTTDSDKKVLACIENFTSASKKIYEFKIKVDSAKKSKSIDIEKGSFALYVSGQDSYADSVSETSRSDVNLLMVVNLKTKQILLVSIPRDYYINISSKGAKDKLTHISLYGSEEAMSSLGDLLDVSVDYFVKFNFTTFMRAVEYLLPLDVYSDYDFTTSVYDQMIGNSYTFSKGYNHITDRKMALQFVRARKNFQEGDRQRGINQSRFLRAVINKASTPSVLLKYNKILKALEGTFLTNITDDSIVEIVKYVINNNGSFNISSFSLDGSDASRPTYSGGAQALYVMIPNVATIESAKIHIKTVLDGGVPDIETDASILADPSDSHDVPYKDIGKSYSYVGGTNHNSTINNNQNNSVANNDSAVKNDNNESSGNPIDKDKEEDDDKGPTEPSPEPSPTPTPTPTPEPKPSESPSPSPNPTPSVDANKNKDNSTN